MTGGKVTQAEITRAIKAAQATGLTVFEVRAGREGVRVITSPPARAEISSVNPWDEVLTNGKA
jgi:hypothetical protein